MGRTSIEWTDYSWPVITGCTRVSEGCRHCYAERLTATRLAHLPQYTGLAILNNRQPSWTGEVRLNRAVLDAPLHWRKPRRIFVCEMSDLFHEKVPYQWIDSVFAVMAVCPQHTFQVLTKRIERVEAYAWPIEAVARRTGAEVRWPLANVWLGVSVEDQKTADWRIRRLLQIPAAIHFVSYEPALAPVDLSPYLESGLDWVIAGGESGPGARPAQPEWFRAVRDQCQRRGVPFFFKQWGGARKDRAGRLLDGRTWDEMPAWRAA